MSTMVERVARALTETQIRSANELFKLSDPRRVRTEGDILASVEAGWRMNEKDARAAIKAMIEPTEDQLDAVRHLVQWHTFGRPTEAALALHCSALRKEPPEGCGSVDHVPPTNMVSYWIFQGIIQAALKDPE